jgi:hypothetical protein
MTNDEARMTNEVRLRPLIRHSLFVIKAFSP